MASNFFNKASLVMVPDAPIDGKLPSVKPEDRSGDFTFSRGSNLAATRVNKGGLIEKGRENLLLQSNQFDTTWLNASSSETSGQTGYDGSSDAWLLNKSGSGGRIYQNVAVSGLHTFSVYAKADTLNWVSLWTNIGTSYFDLENGVVGDITASTSITSNIESVGNGWYRCSFVFNTTISQVRIYPANGNLDTSGSSGSIYIQDAQLEQGLVATGYIETTTATVQKGILENLPRIDYSGGASCPSLLLEPQRTQLIPQSEYFGGTQWPVDGVSLDANNATSPEGLQNAYKITDDTSTGYHKITKTNVFAADGTMRTWSVFVKKGNARYCVISHAEIFSSYVNSLIFDMQEGVYTNEGTTDYFDIVQEPIDMGNGWWRIGFSSDLNSSSYDNFSIGISRGADWLNNASYTGDGSLNFYIYGAQLELGSYPTSYIPAYGSSVTRSLDDAQTTPADTIDTQSFTLFFEHKALGSSGTDWIYRLDINGTSDNISFYVNSSVSLNVYLGNANGGYIFGSSLNDGFTIGSNSKVALSYDGNRLAYFINGSLYDSATGVSFNDANNKLIIRGVKNIINKQTIAFPTALTDDECIALTTI